MINWRFFAVTLRPVSFTAIALANQERQRQLMAEAAEHDLCPQCGAVIPRETCNHKPCILGDS